MARLIAISKINISQDTQVREAIDEMAVDEYAEAMRGGTEFDPIVLHMEVCRQGESYWISDGFHRVAAAIKCGLEEIEAEVLLGDKRDALAYAFSCNLKHGVRLTNADKRRKVMMALEYEIWREKSNVFIADLCCVNEKTVRNVKKASSDYPKIDTQRKVTRNGKEYEMDTANIGKSKAEDCDGNIDKEDGKIQGEGQSADLGSSPDHCRQCDALLLWEGAIKCIQHGKDFQYLSSQEGQSLFPCDHFSLFDDPTLDEPWRDDPKSYLATLQKKKAHVSNNGGNNEWYTPPRFIEAAREVMGSINLDPASCARANETVKADDFYIKEVDGLSLPWGGNVWLNPPYSQPLIQKFCEAVKEKYLNGEFEQLVILTNNATETDWGQTLLSTARAVCFPSKRIRFIDPEGNEGDSPLQGQMLCYFGETPEKFVSIFQQFGVTYLWGVS